MSEDIATIGVKADTTQTDAMTRSLDALANSGKGVEASVDGVNTKTDRLVAGMRQAGLGINEMSSALKNLGLSTQQVNAALGISDTVIKQTATSLAGLGATTVEFATLQQGINTAVGLTDTALKSATASAAAFAQSLAGLAAIEASAAEGMSAIGLAATATAEAQAVAAASSNEFALSMLKSLTGLSDAQLGVAAAATEEAETVVAANQAMSSSAVANAETTVAANDAIIASSIKVRESLVILRELSRGDLTRLAGSATILAQAFGVLYAALIPLAAIAAVVGGALAIVKNQLNEGVEGTGDLTKGLGLSADQLDKVKDRYVSFGDTIKGIWKEVKDEVGGTGLGDKVQAVWNAIASFIYDTLINVTGAVQGSVNVIIEEWKRVPVALGGQGDWKGAGVNASKAFQEGFDSNKKQLDDMFGRIADNARTIATNRILKEAGAFPSDADSAANAAEKQIQQINDQTDAYAKYNDVLKDNADNLGAVNEQQREDSALKSVIARLEQDEIDNGHDHSDLIIKLKEGQHSLNQEMQDYAILMQTAHNEQTEELLDKEVQTLGLTNLERAKAIAYERELLDLKNRNVDPTSTTGKTALDSAVELAAHQEAAKEITDEYNKSLQAQSDILQEIAVHAQNMASGLSDALGHVGTAIEGLTKSFTNYNALQAKFAEQQADIDKRGAQNSVEQIELTQKKHDTDVEYYADVLDASKNFFAQGSAGYKILQAAETAYRVYQLASSIAGIAAKATETTAVVSLNAAQTASSATTAVANAAADVPFPFNLGAIATIVAVLAGFGILAGGSGGAGAAATPVDVAKSLQAAQGTGSVLGDSTAKSDSIAKSLDELTKDTNTDLEYSSQMVISLRNIDTKIGSLTSLLARQLAVGGVFDTSKLGLGSSSNPGLGSSIPLIGGILGSLFGSSSSSTTLLDQGITVAATTIGQAIANGVQANAYQTTKTDTHSSSLFGLISSSSSNTKTNSTALSSDFTDTISGIVGSLRSTVLDAASKLGVEGAQSVIDAFSINIGSISFKDLTGSEIQDALNAVFSKLGDDITSAVFPQLASLEQAGEGQLQTLSRLVQEYTAVDDAAKTVGFTFAQTGVDSLAARDAFIQASGGLDNFTKQASFFTQNFISSSKALVPIQKAVNDELARLGFVGITTKNQFADLIQGIDVTTDAGQALYAALQNVAPAFAKVADAAANLASQKTDLQIKLLQAEGFALAATTLQRQKEIAALDESLVPLQKLTYAAQDLTDANSALSTAKNNLATAQANALNAATSAQNSAVRSQNQTLQQLASTFTNFATSLGNFQLQLSAGATLTTNILRQYSIARSVFSSTAAAAATGDQTALGNIQNAATTFLTASKAAATSAVQQARDLSTVRNAVAAAQNAAQHQADIATQQLTALNIINDSVLSVADAISQLADAQAKVDAAQLAFLSAQAGVNPGDLPSHASGLPYVPYDNYAARLHRGERVLNQSEAASYRSNTDMLNEIRALRREVGGNTKTTNDLLLRFTNDGENLNVKVAS